MRYYKKQDQYQKTFIRFNEKTKEILAVYRNSDKSRTGINLFFGDQRILDNNYSSSTATEFESKLEFALKIISDGSAPRVST